MIFLPHNYSSRVYEDTVVSVVTDVSSVHNLLTIHFKTVIYLLKCADVLSVHGFYLLFAIKMTNLIFLRFFLIKPRNAMLLYTYYM